MTTLTVATSDVEPRARFADLLISEWIKLWSLRSTCWVIAIGTLTMIGLNINATIADYNNWPSYNAGRRANFDPLQDAFGHSPALLLMLAAGSIGAIAITSEYASGLIRTTFVAVPARRSVMAAKAIVVGSVLLGAGTVIAASSFAITQAILSGRHTGWSITHPVAFRALAASSLLAPGCALVGMGIGALIRHTAITIVAVIVGLDLLPQFFNSQQHQWVTDIGNAMPINAWETLVNPSASSGPNPETVTQSWIVLALWAIVAAIVAVTAVNHRDV
jgi:ABC-2 type transport system permease protein